MNRGTQSEIIHLRVIYAVETSFHTRELISYAIIRYSYVNLFIDKHTIIYY